MRVLLMATIAVFAGCSAGRASFAMLQADRAIRHAQERGADEQAAYEFTMAQAYLVKAREEAQFSSYRDSVELSRGAAAWADKALIAMEAEGREGAASAADAPGGTTTIRPAGLPGSEEPEPTPVPPASAEPPPPAAPAAEPDQAEPQPAIVVPVTPPTPTPKPKLIIVPRGPEGDDETPDEPDEP